MITRLYIIASSAVQHIRVAFEWLCIALTYCKTIQLCKKITETFYLQSTDKSLVIVIMAIVTNSSKCEVNKCVIWSLIECE